MHFFDQLGGDSPAMRRVFSLIERISSLDLTVLICGETGTGKDLVARSIHDRSARSRGPFVPVNTGAIAKDLIASELFGHERGAFTGATERRRGKFELASGGTLFLDEISTTDVITQVSLLRVLESQRFQRVGGERYLKSRARVICATNVDLIDSTRRGEFREDLFHRLNVFRIDVPPLRARGEDVSLLAEHFLKRYRTEFDLSVREFAPEAMERLQDYAWPGNVRELENSVLRSAITATGAEVTVRDLPDPVRDDSSQTSVVVPIGSSLEDAERSLIRATVHSVGGNKSKSAEILGISRKALYNKVKEYELDL